MGFDEIRLDRIEALGQDLRSDIPSTAEMKWIYTSRISFYLPQKYGCNIAAVNSGLIADMIGDR